MHKYIVAALTLTLRCGVVAALLSRLVHHTGKSTCELLFSIILTILNSFFNRMDKVHSAIKSHECVNILQQVNVKEDTEAVPSGHLVML